MRIAFFFRLIRESECVKVIVLTYRNRSSFFSSVHFGLYFTHTVLTGDVFVTFCQVEIDFAFLKKMFLKNSWY